MQTVTKDGQTNMTAISATIFTLVTVNNSFSHELNPMVAFMDSTVSKTHRNLSSGQSAVVGRADVDDTPNTFAGIRVAIRC